MNLCFLYDRKYFNRHFLCNSMVWTCELTGKPNLSYVQAVESEAEAKKQLGAFPDCYRRAALSLIHNIKRTNIRMFVDEAVSFYRERFIVGEVVDLIDQPGSSTSTKGR